MFKRALCVTMAGGLLLGCLTGCGDRKETGGSTDVAADTPAGTPSVSQAVDTPVETPSESQAVDTPIETPSAPQEEVVFSGPEDKTCTSYVIPEGVTTIGDVAFEGCTSLTSIEVPEGMDVSRWGLSPDVQVIYYQMWL